MRVQTRDLALAVVYAALYSVLVFMFAPISFGPLQFRIAGILRPGIAKKRVLAVGYAVGVFIGNLFTPFPLYYEIILMPAMSFIAGLAGHLVAKWFRGNYFIAGAVIATIIPICVSWMLSQPLVGNVPMILSLPYLFIAEQTVCFIGATAFRLIDTRFRWWQR